MSNNNSNGFLVLLFIIAAAVIFRGVWNISQSTGLSMNTVAQVGIQAILGNGALFVFYKFIPRSFDRWWSLIFAVNFWAFIPAIDEYGMKHLPFASLDYSVGPEPLWYTTALWQTVIIIGLAALSPVIKWVFDREDRGDW
ncbi:hypothetical protein [Microbulbifer epialgicus]|uniref:Uncharacterized protein n=1 Tax=Microbulbifer epialgicus TaxID=393907 RepID=A0ABV4P4L7_9GAMM